MPEKTCQDVLLWLQFKNGSRDAFAAIYKHHSASLLAYGLRICPDRDQLKDQVQELFVELWNSRENLAATDSVRFYLFKALRYKLIRLEKAGYAGLSISHLSAGLLQEPIEESVVGREEEESRIGDLKKAIRALTARQQEIIHLRFYQGFSHEEIAALLGMNYQSVSNLLYRAIHSLKGKLRSPALSSLLIFLFFRA